MNISGKAIIKSGIISASVERLWWQWTTHEGLLTFFGRDNKIELQPEGPFEIYFLMDNPTGLRGSEGCRVLSYIPNRMFSFTWNTPPQFRNLRDSGYHTWVVVEFRPLSGISTEVKITHTGWPDNAEWNPVYDYFMEAWDTVMQWLERSNQ